MAKLNRAEVIMAANRLRDAEAVANIRYQRAIRLEAAAKRAHEDSRKASDAVEKARRDLYSAACGGV